MLKNFFVSFILLSFVSISFAATFNTNFIILPNINTTYLMETDASKALDNQQKAIDVIKKSIDTTQYKTIRIRLLYNDHHEVNALIVYLLSTQFKTAQIVRIDLNANWEVTNIIPNYSITSADLSQSPSTFYKRKPNCPDDKVQFVIGNNFYGDDSVETEVQRVYQAALTKGYNPFLMDVNNPTGPQPTVQSYEDWMSCPNVKGFYNESHGYEQGILLTDDDFTYRDINSQLVGKLDHEVILFDSCETFHNPLLDAMLNPNKGNTQQYVAGIISLPFGSSERTARCFWLNAINDQELTKTMLKNCSIESGLDPNGYGIAGNGDNHLTAPV